ncbi:unnamed protein product [Didymodactylos carnosus]|uniref:Uncharacterized protein n=1 Tax=Didymodactylos carnosus TaxID=1234261 RepID=A0A8S2EET9_9BILA|nr:unnamed protein product [Didymodactylos carnosus]CAF4015520.1 unnamed protein product [Didymodactylos carnosus]
MSDIDCYGIAMDNDGFIYVVDSKKGEVWRWKKGERQSAIVAGGNGNGSQSNQLNDPTFVFVDDEQSVYVSNWGNHRVMKWRRGTKVGVVVAGGNGEEGRLDQLSYPHAVLVDQWGQI